MSFENMLNALKPIQSAF